MHQRALQRGLVRSYQITSIFKRLSVQDNLALALQAVAGSSMRFWRPVRAEHAALCRQPQTVAERVGLAGPVATRLAGALSHGRAAAAGSRAWRWPASPQLLVLDEPMAGMGPDESERMVALLQCTARRDHAAAGGARHGRGVPPGRHHLGTGGRHACIASGTAQMPSAGATPT